MPIEFLYQQSELLIVGVLGVAFGIAGELGYRLGWRGRAAHGEPARPQIRSIQAAILGLLSLLLGFTFAMAVSRFEYRKQMVVEESNAIGTAALRAQFLPATNETEVEAIFRRYVEIRLDAVLRTVELSPARRQLDAETELLQARLWKMASAAAEADPRSVPLGLFTHAVNQVIDIKMKRDIAVANHVPESVELFLIGLSTL